MFGLELTTGFKRSRRKLIKNNKLLENKIDICLKKLTLNPRDTSLSSHIVNTSKYGQVKSSSVTGDLRIIWDYDQDNRLVILVIDIGGHSGSRSVYL